MEALTVLNASKKFRQQGQEIIALDAVSITIHSGEIFGLLGPNGAGKTTLISAVCGLLELDQGKITVLGKDVLRQRNEIIPEINLVTGFAGLLNGLNVEDLLRYYTLLYSIPNKQEQIETVLQQTELEEKRKQIANTLSSGYRQRFYIAKALLTKPRLLLMDEPTVGLDVQSSRNIRSLVKKLKKQGITVLLTTHYMSEAEELCDRLAIIRQGKIVAVGTLKELKQKAGLKNGSLEEVFLALTHEQWEGDFVESND